MIILDIETSGLDPIRNGLLSIGAVDYDSGEEFYGECRVWDDFMTKPGVRGNQIAPQALAVNGFTVPQCFDSSKQRPDALYMQFLAWAALDSKRDLLLAGQQVGSFDVLFLKAIASDRDLGIVPIWPFGHRSVDLHSVAYAKLGQSLSLDGILAALGLSPEPKPHNALTGARLERDAFKLLLAR